jgi:hypothetical protein
MQLLGYMPEAAIYGITADTSTFSVSFAICMLLFLLKGSAAIGLLTEKDWGVPLAIADAVLGLASCIYAMYFALRYMHTLSVRLELFLLIPYLIIMLRIRKDWAANRYVTQQLVA